MAFLEVETKRSTNGKGMSVVKSALQWIAISLASLLLVGCVTQSQASEQETVDAPLQSAQCRISLIEEEHQPQFTVSPEALRVPREEEFQKAYFAMGCFWGSEALLASAEGVVATRVGFSGGTLANPDYSAIGDHVETVEVLFDSRKTSYPALLQHFWKNHNSRAKPIFRQYASAIFCVDEEQMSQAKLERDKWQAETGEERVLTAVLEASDFYPAGESHQKYYLQQDQNLLDSLPGTQQRLETLLATKLNAVSGRAGDRATLEGSLSQLGIDTKARDLLFQRALWPEPAP